MVVRGAEDNIVPPSSSEKAHRKLDDSELMSKKNLGHSYHSHLDTAAEEAVEFFLETIPVTET